jgi:hypothetical protein
LRIFWCVTLDVLVHFGFRVFGVFVLNVRLSEAVNHAHFAIGVLQRTRQAMSFPTMSCNRLPDQDWPRWLFAFRLGFSRANGDQAARPNFGPHGSH